ncbi:hypothetical protein V1525DRAFT_414546 [Lipomyces kononenkoae]|uniref:Uncharacterized protein n=1 Tax=Lipomyces kononenkoae TaxID=34357 RepID=A0ACC3STB5_LIPKO
MPLVDYLDMLKSGGRFVQLRTRAASPSDAVRSSQMQFGPLNMLNASLLGSLLGSRSEITEMLELSADKGVKSWVTAYAVEEVNKVIGLMEDGKANYRFVHSN